MTEADSSPFLQSAGAYRKAGAAPIPCGGVDGKIPQVRWRNLRRAPSLTTIQEWGRKHVNANVGLVTGLSGITAVDVDDPAFLDAVVDDVGASPVVARTPRGGIHLFFKSGGEKTVTKLHGSPVDVRGIGGFIVAPPSCRPGGGTYRFVEGDIEGLADLPNVRHGSLPLHPRQAAPTTPDCKIAEGCRNRTLFQKLKAVARDVSSEEELMALAVSINSGEMSGPLPESEVSRTARQIWDYRARGTLILPGQRGAFMEERALKELVDEPTAGMLFLILKFNHLGVREEFYLVADAMKEATSWNPRTVTRARDILIDRGYLRKTRDAGGRGNPARYAFGERVRKIHAI